MSKRTKSQLMFIGGLLLLIVICNFFTGGVLLSPQNLRTIITYAVFPTITAFGMCFIFAGGLIDLSIGANVLLSANVGALLCNQLRLGYPGLILGTILCTVVCEQICVQCSISLNIPSWISGLGATLILEAILSWWSIAAASNAQKLPDIGSYKVFGRLPGALILLLICFAATYILFNKTTLGINVQAVGGNSAVAEIMGIKTKKTIFLATVVGSVFIGLAAVNDISYSGRLDCVSGLSSMSTVFKSLASVLLAGSIQNIFTKPVGVFIAAFAISSLFNVLTLFGVPSGTYQNVALGLVVIVCGMLSHWKFKGVVK